MLKSTLEAVRHAAQRGGKVANSGLIRFAFLAGCGLLSFPLFLAGWLRALPSPVERLSAQFGMPLVSSSLRVRGNKKQHDRQTEQDNNETIKKLALRIKQTAADTGAIVLFAGSRSDGSQMRLLSPLSRYLSQRETSVLIMDAAGSLSDVEREGVVSLLPSTVKNVTNNDELPSSRPHPGVADYLSGECDQIDSLLVPTQLVGVDFISHGSKRFSIDEMGSSRANLLLRNARKKYNVILLTGPSLEQANG